MKREVNNRDSLLTALDVKILDYLKDGKISNINQIAKGTNSTQSVVKENLIHLKNYNLVKMKTKSIKNIIRHQVSINKIHKGGINEIIKIFLFD